jgi:hypothetical protein
MLLCSAWELRRCPILLEVDVRRADRSDTWLTVSPSSVPGMYSEVTSPTGTLVACSHRLDLRPY